MNGTVRSAGRYGGNMTTFGERLKLLIGETGKTYRQIAAESGVKKSNIATWINTDAMPNGKNLAKLCIYFDVSADWLLGLNNYRRLLR